MTSIVIRKPNSQGGLAPGDGQDAFHADAPLRRGEDLVIAGRHVRQARNRHLPACS